MTIDKRREGGIAMVIAAVVLVIIVGAGYWVWHRHHNSSNLMSSSNSSSTKKSASSNASNAKSNGASASSSSATSSSSASAAAACGDLALSKGSSEGAAGTIYWHAVITNNGSDACTLAAGYPTATMTDSSSVSINAESNSLYPQAAVVLAAHGGTAYAVVGLPNPGNFDPGTTTCTAAATSKLRLHLPGVSTYVETAFGEAACPGFSVTALQPGT